MHAHRNASKESTVGFSRTLNERLRNEAIEKVTISAHCVDVPRGHLAVILSLNSDSTPDERLKAERIANKECIKYLQEGRKKGKTTNLSGK